MSFRIWHSFDGHRPSFNPHAATAEPLPASPPAVLALLAAARRPFKLCEIVLYPHCLHLGLWPNLRSGIEYGLLIESSGLDPVKGIEVTSEIDGRARVTVNNAALRKFERSDSRTRPIAGIATASENDSAEASL
jgi:hypothetical protein